MSAIAFSPFIVKFASPSVRRSHPLIAIPPFYIDPLSVRLPAPTSPSQHPRLRPAPHATSGSGTTSDYTPPAPPPEGQPATVTNVTTHANVRAQPSLYAEIIGQVAPNEAIRLIRWSKDGQWCLILHNGEQNQGWLNYQFIKAQ